MSYLGYIGIFLGVMFYFVIYCYVVKLVISSEKQNQDLQEIIKFFKKW